MNDATFLIAYKIAKEKKNVRISVKHQASYNVINLCNLLGSVCGKDPPVIEVERVKHAR